MFAEEESGSELDRPVYTGSFRSDVTSVCDARRSSNQGKVSKDVSKFLLEQTETNRTTFPSEQQNRLRTSAASEPPQNRLG